MFKVMVCLLVGVPAISYAHDYGCATVGASMESSLFDAINTSIDRLAFIASSIVTLVRTLVSGLRVVSHNSLESCSPNPL